MSNVLCVCVSNCGVLSRLRGSFTTSFLFDDAKVRTFAKVDIKNGKKK